jgi:GT2 family glycosyltransferase
MLSVLIVNWNTREHLRACLHSIQRFPAAIPTEAIVVDNASSDGSADMVAAEHPWARLMPQSRNLGYAAANNIAFAAARGDRILTLNPDVELTEGALDVCLELLSLRPCAGSVAPALVGPDGRIQRSVRGFPSVLGIAADVLGLGKIFPNGPFDAYRLRGFDYEREQEAPQPMGSFLLFRRDALPDVRPFDEAFPIFFNEVDLLYRMRQAGWSCLYTPRARVIHHHGASTRQVPRAMVWESHRSLVRYLRKHARGAERSLIPIVAAAAWAGAFIRARGWSPGF